MNSRDRVLSAFAHEEPDRVPAWCGASDGFWAKAKRELDLDDEALRQRFGDDFRRVNSRHNGSNLDLSPAATSRTVFGIERAGIGYGQPISHPLAAATMRDVDEYPWPDPSSVDISHIRAEAEAYGGRYAILGGEWAPFWHDLIDLLGMENMCLQMYDAPLLIDTLLERIVGYYAEVSQRIFDEAASSIDVFFIGNDFGSQAGPLLSEAMFRRFIFSHLRRLVDLGHDYGLKVMLHCCGGFYPLIPALIEVGLDGLHAIQPCCHGMDLVRLKKEFGDKIVLNGAIDSHHVLIEGTPESVKQRTREVLDIMKPGGGYIGGASHDTILEETPVENAVAMFDAIQEFGAYDG